MTQKHFIILANAVRDIPNKENKQLILNFLLKVLPSFNSKFNSQRFVDFVNSDYK